MTKSKNRLDVLESDRERTLKRISKVKRRIAEEKENEEAWPGHENTIFLDDLNQLEVFENHLKSIETQIELLKKGR